MTRITDEQLHAIENGLRRQLVDEDQDGRDYAMGLVHGAEIALSLGGAVLTVSQSRALRKVWENVPSRHVRDVG